MEVPSQWEEIMKGLVGFLAGAALLGAVAAPVAFAQSSGNFSYGNTGTTHCVLNNDGTGAISGGQLCSSQAGPSCTTTADCPAVAVGAQALTCFNPTGGTLAGQCVNNTSGAACTSNAGCTVPGQTC